MKYISVFLFLTMVCGLSYGQTNERYKIVVVDKLSEYISVPDTSIFSDQMFAQPNENKSVLMLDTQTGKTWILTKEFVHEDYNSKLYIGKTAVVYSTLVWQQLLFAPINKTNREFEKGKLKSSELMESPK